MKKIKAFFYVFRKSLTSFEYYKDILDTSFSFSIKYLAVLAMLATIVTVGITSVTEVPKINGWIYDQKNNLLDLYPNDLEITVNNNEWSINEEEPFEIKTPDYMFDDGGNIPSNLIILNHEGTINDFEDSDTMVLVNKSNMLVKSETKFEVYSLENLPNGTFTKQNFIETLDQVDGVVRYVPVIFVLVAGIFLFFYYFIYRLVYLLPVAMTLLIVNMFVKPDVEFKHLYRIALHSMTAPLLIDMLLRILSINVTIPIPWFFFLNVVLGAFVIAKATRIND